MTTDPYRAAATALIVLGETLSQARDARFQDPPKVASEEDAKPSNRTEVSDPTLSTVLDPRRSALSDEVSETHKLLRAMSVRASAQNRHLSNALARWNNEEDGDGDDSALA